MTGLSSQCLSGNFINVIAIAAKQSLKSAPHIARLLGRYTPRTVYGIGKREYLARLTDHLKKAVKSSRTNKREEHLAFHAENLDKHAERVLISVFDTYSENII